LSVWARPGPFSPRRATLCHRVETHLLRKRPGATKSTPRTSHPETKNAAPTRIHSSQSGASMCSQMAEQVERPTPTRPFAHSRTAYCCVKRDCAGRHAISKP